MKQLPILIVSVMLGWGFCLMLLPATPAAAQADFNEREQMLYELQSLLAKLTDMHNQVKNRPAPLRQTQPESQIQRRTSELAPASYYTGPYQAIYLIDERGMLEPWQNTVWSPRDQDLWDLWSKIVGPNVIANYIREFRMYHDPDAEYDAFVEQLGTSDTWIVGVNLAANHVDTELEREAAIELFVHEYAHILYHYEDELQIEFEDTFWLRQSSNQRHYVSTYAMINSEEDFADSFMHFVLYEKPTGNLIRNEKVLMFYDYEAMRDVREDIRDRLFH